MGEICGKWAEASSGEFGGKMDQTDDPFEGVGRPLESGTTCEEINFALAPIFVKRWTRSGSAIPSCLVPSFLGRAPDWVGDRGIGGRGNVVLLWPRYL